METNEFWNAFKLTLLSLSFLALLSTSIFAASRIWIRMSTTLQKTRLFRTLAKDTQILETLCKQLFKRAQHASVGFFKLLGLLIGQLLREIESLELGELAIMLLIAGSFIAMPFIVLLSPELKISTASVLGIATAGALLGLLMAPLVTWRNRQLGFVRVVGLFTGTIVGSSWFSCFVVAMLIVMASD